MKKEASKVAHNRPIFFSVLPTFRIQPKSQFLFHKNLPPRDLSILTLVTVEDRMLQINHTVLPCTPCLFQVHFFSRGVTTWILNGSHTHNIFFLKIQGRRSLKIRKGGGAIVKAKCLEFRFKESLHNTASLRNLNFCTHSVRLLRKPNHVLLWVLSNYTGLCQCSHWAE